MKTFKVRVESLQPLLMKSPRGVDPTDPIVKQIKAITSKRSKQRTDADLALLDKLEFMVGLYWNDKAVYVPDVNLIGAIRDGAKANRRGREISAGVDVIESEIPLLYDGPKTPDQLYEARFADRRMVKNKGGGGAVMRVRPRFNKWALEFSVIVDEHVIEPQYVRDALEHAGLRVGLGDFRPRFGRFSVVGWKEAA
jgi:hypothetical protein